MKEAQKKFLGAALAVSSIAGIVAPSVTAMATVVDDEQNATPDQLKAVINEYSVKLEKNPIFANYHRVKYAAERLAQYDEQYANDTINSIAKYDNQVYTKDIVKLVDKMNEFSMSKNMEIYDELINEDIPAFAKNDKESADYLLDRLDVWGKAIVFEVDKNYSKATDEIVKVNTLREKDKLEEALDQVDVAKKAIKNIITYDINGKYLEGKLKIEEDKVRHDIQERDLYVREVSAINAREIKVAFNKEVSKDSAEDKDNYDFKAANTDAVSWDLEPQDIELQDDNKSVIIKLVDKKGDSEEGKPLNNKTNAKYLVTIKDVLTDDEEEMKEYSEIMALYDDVKPEVTDLEYRDADTLRINFSEPVRLSGMSSAIKIKSDGSTVRIPSKAITKYDDDCMYVEISRSKAGLDSDKTYDLEIDGLTDYAGNALVKYTSDLLFDKDTVRPEVEKIEALSENAFRVTFSEKITNIDKDGDLQGENIFKVSSSDKNIKVDSIKHNEKDDDRDYKTFVVKLKNNISGKALITISDFHDLAGNDSDSWNKGDAKTLDVNFEESNPVLESTTPEYKTIKGNKYAVYTFDRDVRVGSENTVKVKHVDSDGVTKTDYPRIYGSEDTDGAKKENTLSKDNLETNEIAVNIDGLEEGEYNFDLEKKNVEDEYNQNVEKINLEFTKGDKVIKFDVDTVATYQYVKTNNKGETTEYEDRYDNDKVVVTFKKPLTKQGVRDASKPENYYIDGRLAVEKAEVLEGKTKVELTLKEDEITTNVDERIVEIRDIDGVKDYNEKVKMKIDKDENGVKGKLISGIFENERPVIDKAEAIAFNTIKLTMSEEMKDKLTGEPIEVRDNGNKLDIAEKTNGKQDITINGNVITIKVDGKDPLKNSNEITIKVLDSDDDNITDLVGNKIKQVTVDVDRNFDTTLVEAIEAVNTLKENKNPSDTDIENAQKYVNKLQDGTTDKINLQKEIDEIKAKKNEKDKTEDGKLNTAVENIGKEVIVDSTNNTKNLKEILELKANNETKVNSIDSIDAKLDGVIDKEGKITPPTKETKTGDVKVTLKNGDTTREVTVKVTVNETTAPTIEDNGIYKEKVITIKASEALSPLQDGDVVVEATNDNDFQNKKIVFENKKDYKVTLDEKDKNKIYVTLEDSGLNKLVPGEKCNVKVTVKNTVKDLAGNALKEDKELIVNIKDEVAPTIEEKGTYENKTITIKASEQLSDVTSKDVAVAIIDEASKETVLLETDYEVRLNGTDKSKIEIILTDDAAKKIVPSANFKIKVTIKNTVQDLSGNKLAQEKVITIPVTK